MWFFHKKNKIRTRFAPSPTGYLHVGGLRTALYAYLVAKQNNGDFVLRIEDTDKTREVSGAVANLIQSLQWAGISPDEGVILDQRGNEAERGKYGPYKQSDRLKIYQRYVDELLASGMAYHCFCTEERLNELRQNQEALKQPTQYDGRCRLLSKEEVDERLKAGEKSVIRLKVPENIDIEFNDLIRGNIKINSREVDDQVLIKSDGFPTYHFANVVDDHLMAISHVIRGEEWLPSTPKHILLYRAFGWEPPFFAHLPLLLNQDKSKLSKRQGDVAVEDYRDKGYLPEALLNFVSLLGWNPGDEKEIFSLSELIKEFDFKKIHKAGAVFDLAKLDWMNGEYLKKLSPEKFVELAWPFLIHNIPAATKQRGLAEKALVLEKDRIKTLAEAGQGIGFIFLDQLDYDSNMLVWKKSDASTAKKNLSFILEFLKTINLDLWNKEFIEKEVIEKIKNANLTNGEVLWPLRVALTGLEKSPTPFEVAEILGKEKTLTRIELAIAKID